MHLYVEYKVTLENTSTWRETVCSPEDTVTLTIYSKAYMNSYIYSSTRIITKRNISDTHLTLNNLSIKFILTNT
jgi:hypothetical protein